MPLTTRDEGTQRGSMTWRALPPGASRPLVRATHHGDMVDNAYYRGLLPSYYEMLNRMLMARFPPARASVVGPCSYCLPRHTTHLDPRFVRQMAPYKLEYGTYCLPHPSTHSEPSSLDLNGTLCNKVWWILPATSFNAL